MPLTKPTPRLFFFSERIDPIFCRKTHLKGGFFHWPCPDFAKGKVHKKNPKKSINGINGRSQLWPKILLEICDI